MPPRYRRRPFARLAVICLGAHGAALPLPPGSSDPPKTIFGVYGQAKGGNDSVRVTRKPNGKIGVTVKLYYGHGHTCHLNQDGDWQADHIAVQAEGLDRTKPCSLSLYFNNGRVLLKDPNSLCAAVYCGARGKFDQVSLPRTSSRHK
jgi:hypothetical protein